MTVYERLLYYIEGEIDKRFDENNYTHGDNHDYVKITLNDIKITNDKIKNDKWKYLFEYLLPSISVELNKIYKSVSFNIKEISLEVYK